MSRDRVTVIWLAGNNDEPPSELSELASFARVEPKDLELTLVRMREIGAVVVVGDASAADRALSLGADEVVPRDPEVARLTEAISRARARSSMRLKDPDAAPGQELAAVALLGAAIGHEINNPLTAATLNCEWLEKQLLPLTSAIEALDRCLVPGHTDPSELSRTLTAATQANAGEVKDALHDLSLALGSVQSIVRRMVDLTTTYAPATCNLCDIASALAEIARPQVERFARFSVTTCETPCIVEMGGAQAMAVVSSVLSNAIEAVKDRAPGEGAISVYVGFDDDLIVAEVSDNGCGMVPEVRRQALNPFFTTRRPGSLGLGLTFAAMHVRNAGGELLIDSEPGVGSSVRMFMPPVPPSWQRRADIESLPKP
jgi:signal transduction histidine kinase